MEKKISVIVPVYNVENYLNRCVDSIINQTHNNLELILVNDGSVDKSKNICDDYAIKDDRVVVIHKKNEGSSCARNAGLDMATGDYISFVDSDDFIEKETLEIMLDHLVKHNLKVVEFKAINKLNVTTANGDFEIQDKITAIKRVIQDTTFSVWRRVYKATLIEDLRFIPKIIHQDVFFTMDVLNKIEEIGYLRRKLYIYNTDNVSIIRSAYSLEKITIGIRATEYVRKNIPKVPELKQALDDYVTYYYTDHYFLLSRNTHIDPNNAFRKKLRKAVRDCINYKNYSLRSLMVMILPYKIMEYVSSTYATLYSR